MFEARRFINETLVEPGAVIVRHVTTHSILGRQIKAGAVCEGLHPEAWRALITSEQSRLWQSDEAFPSYEAADRAATEHFHQSMDRALKTFFS